MSFIDVSGVSFTYPNGVEAVADVSFTIERGESVAMIGQNGAGKTTTVKLLNGLLQPNAGTVTVGGESNAGKTPAQIARRVGYVFQNPDDQIFNSTVEKEIAYALKRRKLSAEEIEQRVNSAAQLCGLADDLWQNPYDLPLSVRKFVTIASVVAVSPDVFIFDEPTAGQDSRGLYLINEIIAQLQKQGKVLLTITHDMEFVAANFQRVIVMANKHVVVDGKTHDVFQNQEAMREARLNQPLLAELVSRLGITQRVTTIADLAEILNHK